MPPGSWRVRSFRRRPDAARGHGLTRGWISPPGVVSRPPVRYRSSRLFPPPPGNVTFRSTTVSPLFGWNDATIGFKVVSGDHVPEQGRGPNTRSVEWLLTVM